MSGYRMSSPYNPPKNLKKLNNKESKAINEVIQYLITNKMTPADYLEQSKKLKKKSTS